MAGKQFLTNIDLNGNQLLESRVENLASDPVTLWAGRVWINTTSHLLKYYDGSGIVSVGSSEVTAGDGMTQSGNTLNVVGTTNRISVSENAVDISSSYVGQTSITTLGTITSGTWNGTDIAVADGGTGASTAAGAKTNLGFMSRYAVTFGTGSDLTYTITHSMGTRDVNVTIYELSTYYEVEAIIAHTTIDTITVTVESAPGVDALRCVVIG